MFTISQVAFFASGGVGRHREHHPGGLRAGGAPSSGTVFLAWPALARERLRKIGLGPLALAPAAPAARGRGRPDHPQLAREWRAKTPEARMPPSARGAVYFMVLMGSTTGHGGTKINRGKICW